MLCSSSDSGVMLVAPFAGGKKGLIRELKKLYNVSGGVKVKVKRGSSVIEVRAKVAVDESSLLKKTYVLASATDSGHVATLVDAMEQDCLVLQEKSRKVLEASKILKEYSKKDDLLVKLGSMKLKDSYVNYPWEQKMMTFLPVSGSAMLFSLLIMPPALSTRARDYACVEQTSSRAVAWLSAAQASGVPITFVNIQTEHLFMQFADYQVPGYKQDPAVISNSGCYRLQDREAMDMDVVRAVRLWYSPAAAELAIDLRPEANESRLGVGISCTEEGFCYVSSVDPGTVADRAGLWTVYQDACAAGKLLVISRVGGEKIAPWLVASSGSIRCYETISLSNKLSLHRQTGQAIRLHVMLWEGALTSDLYRSPEDGSNLEENLPSVACMSRSVHRYYDDHLPYDKASHHEPHEKHFMPTDLRDFEVTDSRAEPSLPMSGPYLQYKYIN
ncbi:uncharacterized protein [Physcomitrium patens]|uniref:Uncharacterized protein n=1 Tax=Physcomitrium patens TaxID=3218 RepID=A0A7I4AW23_PHYPA|nr:uncharacterized protein LOC112291680 isoform X2 [Physcomitrium patens]|eukprot:XP_024395232.1 uncharacterized protein LOC112291680 isoform X2 [Physcomitrella patens]